MTILTLPCYDDILAAAERINSFITKTPILESSLLNARIGGRVLLKAESLQRTGSFKFRGASNAIRSLDGQTHHVVAYSSGNHAQAIAAVAKDLGIKASIIMPQDAPAVKIANTKAYGADVITYDRYTESREDITAAVAAADRASGDYPCIIPPFDSHQVIAGQGTVGLEINRYLKDKSITADQLVCCTGGGGLLAGVALAIHHEFPDLTIIAAEPENLDDFKRSLETGHRVCNDPAARSICDAIVTPTPGELTFAVNKNHVSHGVSVSDADVLHAMAIAWQDFNISLEPGGAVALAALLSGAVDAQGKTSIVIASGGNVDDTVFALALKTLKNQPRPR